MAMRNPLNFQPPFIYAYDCEEHGIIRIQRAISRDDEIIDRWCLSLNSQVAANSQGQILLWHTAEPCLNEIIQPGFCVDEIDEVFQKFPPPASLSAWQPLESLEDIE